MLLTALFLSLAGPDGYHVVADDKVCPIGGEAFEGTAITSVSTFGRRPDGRPYSYLSFPLPMNECPGNGLLLYRDFDDLDAEGKARLASLIAAEDYQAERAELGRYHRAFLLSQRFEDEADEWLLVSAVWEAKNAEEEARVDTLLDLLAARNADRAIETMDDAYLVYLAANAHRERGRFAEAEAVLDRLQPLPAGVDADAEERDAYGAMAAKMGVVIARGDSSGEPLDLIPEQEAMLYCGVPFAIARFEAEGMEVPPFLLGKLRDSAFERQWCAAPERAEDLQELRENIETG